MSYYQATGYEPALEASRKVGDLLVRTFGTGPGQRDIIAAGTHVGMAATSVLEAMVNLYRITGDVRYLNFCEYLVRSWDQPNGPKIITSLLSKGSVFQTANAKAYEMMSNLVGLVELYRVTGKPEYLKPAEIAWKDIVAHRLYVTGTTSSQRTFPGRSGAARRGILRRGRRLRHRHVAAVDLAVAALTGEPRYADELEHTVYNALLGAQDPANGNICYFTPLDGRKSPTPGINCCVSSEPRGISMIPQLAWGRRGDGAAILFYVPGSVKVDTVAGAVSIESHTTYPMDGAVELTVTPAKAARFPLYLRVPAWTAHYQATAGGRTYQGEPGTYLTIEREWAPGDSVKIDVDLTTRVVPGGPSYPYSVAVARGPQFLVLENSLNRGAADLQAAGPRTAQVKLTDAASQLPATWIGKQAYRMDGLVAGKPGTWCWCRSPTPAPIACGC